MLLNSVNLWRHPRLHERKHKSCGSANGTGDDVCLIVAPRVPHQCPAGAGGHAIVAPEATELLWLVGRVSSSGVFVWSVMSCSRLGAGSGICQVFPCIALEHTVVSSSLSFACLADVRKDPGESFKQAVAVLPHGLEILGVLCAASAKPEWPFEIASIASSQHARGLLLLATRAEDGRLKAWDMQRGLERFHWKVSEPSEICVYSSLSIVLPKMQAEAIMLLTSLASDLSAIRFRFPGTQLVPALADLIDKANVPYSAPESGLVAVEVLSEALGSDGHSNFAEFQCQGQAEHRVDFAAYVSPNSLQVVAQSLVEAAKLQLRQLIREVSQDHLANGTSFAVRCYQLDQHVVCLGGTEVQSTRRELHRLLRLPAAPLLVPSAALPLAGQARSSRSVCDCFFECSQRSCTGSGDGHWEAEESAQQLRFKADLVERLSLYPSRFCQRHI